MKFFHFLRISRIITVTTTLLILENYSYGHPYLLNQCIKYRPGEPPLSESVFRLIDELNKEFREIQNFELESVPSECSINFYLNLLEGEYIVELTRLDS